MPDSDYTPGELLAAATRDTTTAEMAAEIVGAYVAHNSVPAAELPGLIRSVHDTLASLGVPPPAQAPAEPLKPAVPPNKSVTRDYLVSLLDGKHYKSLKRHIGVAGYTPDSYRAAFGLARDYPMVAPAHAEARSALAKSIGLGTLRRATAA